MANRVSRIALDIDGTLSGYGGIIDRETVRMMLETAHVGIVSSRGDCGKIAMDWGLGYWCCSSDKASCLRDYASKYPVPAGSLYIADMPSDFIHAKNAGWNYVNVNKICVNLGAGNDFKRGCINIDVRVLPNIDIVRDLENNPIPLPDESIQTAVLKDFLEHISWRRVEWTMNNLYRKIKHGGRVFIQTPNLDAIIKQVVENKQFRGSFKYRFEAISYWLGGGQDYPENTHKAFWGIDEMIELLTAVGFVNIKCRPDGDTNMRCVAMKP